MEDKEKQMTAEETAKKDCKPGIRIFDYLD